jgi:hypothetical protein
MIPAENAIVSDRQAMQLCASCRISAPLRGIGRACSPVRRNIALPSIRDTKYRHSDAWRLPAVPFQCRRTNLGVAVRKAQHG